jgi:hypothetical protein
VAGGILRDAARERAGTGAGANQAAVLAWGSQMIASTHAPGTAATVEGLRDLVGSALRAAEDHLGDGEPVDEFGFEPEFTSRVLIPIARFFYERWARAGGRQPFGHPPDGRGHGPDRAARRAPGRP